MSRPDELIAEFCPRGVAFRAVGDVTTKSANIKWANAGVKKFQYIDLTSVDRVTRKIGKTVTITAKDAPSRAQQLVQAGDVIFATTRPTQMRWAMIPTEYDGQVASTGYCVLRPDTSAVLTNFLAHILGADTFQQYIKANQVEGNYPSIPNSRVRDYRIPVPPLEVQHEIVRILDQFTQLGANLEAELEARRRQFEHYRKVLLGATTASDAQELALGEIFEMRAGTQIKASEISDNQTSEHPYPCYGGNGLRGYVASFNHDGGAIFIGRQGALCGNVRRAQGKIYATEHAIVVTPKLPIDMSWAFHKLTEMNLNQYKTKSAQPGLAVGRVKNVTTGYLPIDQQRRDGAVLDQLDALVNDRSIGLPAELAARRKQYDYYRDKLLTFKEATA